ncbi:MAG: 30S ribosomal protein S17 [Candidatus Hodarchaeales archaeon]|jgi:small subunit ribosomal protein S17
MKEERSIGFAAPPPTTCEDPNCPFHGNLSVRGKIIEGNVVSDKNHLTVTVQRRFVSLISKYKRYEYKISKMAAHNPPCIDAKAGDRVRIGECRPIAKTVSFVVIEKIIE